MTNITEDTNTNEEYLYLNHWLSDYMTQYGYKNASRGVCLGLARTAIQAISSLKQWNYFIELLKTIQQIFLKKLTYLELLEPQKTDILALLDGIQLLQCPEKYKAFLTAKTKYLSQRDSFDLAFDIMKPLHFQENQSQVYSIYNISGCYTADELQTMLEILGNTISNSIHDNQNQFSFIIYSENHVAALRYNSINNTWNIIDTNILSLPNGIEMINTPYQKQELISLIFIAFGAQEPIANASRIAINTEIFTYHSLNKHSKSIKDTFTETLTKNSVWQSLHQITPNKLNKTIIGGSWLHTAVAVEDYKIVQQLIEAHADVNATSDDGESPLLIATDLEHNDTKMIDLLVNAGAKVNTTTSQGTMILWLAKQHDDPEIFKKLKEASDRSTPKLLL